MALFTDLVAGYRRFREGDYVEEHERWAQLAEGQAPKVMLIGCSDSRVDPSQIFDTSPGEIFVVRNVAALVPPYETGGGRHGVSAALEFAVTNLKVDEIVVVGHGACGGCAAALSGAYRNKAPGEGGFVASWVSMLDDAREKVKAAHGDGTDAALEMEFEAVRVSLANLETFPFVAERLQNGDLTLHGAHFAIKNGVLNVMDESGAFAPA